MTVKHKHPDIYPMYFCSFTCHRWINLFEITNSYDCVYKWFAYLKTKNIDVIAYVIMPNHLHCILYFQEIPFNLNKVIGNAKRFMAYEIIKRLDELNQPDLLTLLNEDVNEREAVKGQKHKAFEKSFDAKAVFTDHFLQQKMDYIHFNPVRGKWNLAEDYTRYKHSSASFYERGEVFHFEPVHYKDVKRAGQAGSRGGDPA